MAQYNFEGDLDNINEIQQEFINKVIQEKDLQVTKVVFSPVGQAGDNFVANVKRISIEGDNGSLKLIVKVASRIEKFRKATNTDAMFNNEHAMYTLVLPKLVQLQKDAGVPEEKQLRYAKCYGSLTKAPNEVILLEDLSESGFSMLNKLEFLSDDCVKSILKNFAILHSLSFVLKKKESEYYDFCKDKLVDTFILMVKTPEFIFHLDHFENEIMSILEDEDHKTIVKNNATDIIKRAIEFSKEDDKFSTITHCDVWRNNVMFKFEGDNVIQSVFIDYQVSADSNPAVDLLFMIFHCTDPKTWSKNYPNWLDYYYTELQNSFSNFNLEANVVYPRNQLNADMKKYGKLQFALSLLMASVQMKDRKEKEERQISDNLKDLKGDLEQDDKQEINKDRIVRLIDRSNELGLL